MWSRNCSKLGAGPSSGGSKAAAQPTCMWADAVSTSRNDTSSAERRFDAIALLLSQVLGRSLHYDWPSPQSSKRRNFAMLWGVTVRVARPDDRFALSSAAVERLHERIAAAVATGAAERRRHPGGDHGANTGRARPQCCCSERQAARRPLCLPGAARSRRLRPRGARRGAHDRGARARAVRGGREPCAGSGARGDQRRPGRGSSATAGCRPRLHGRLRLRARGWRVSRVVQPAARKPRAAGGDALAAARARHA